MSVAGRWAELAGAGEGIRGPERSYHLARFVMLRLLGLVYLCAFAVFLGQGPALLGSDGLLPIADFTSRVTAQLGSAAAAFEKLPSLFWYASSDAVLMAAAWCGAVLSILVLLGLTNAAAMAALWALYMSFVHVGQDWYGYGWEIQLLETGFLAIFLAPLSSWRPFPDRRPAPIVMVLFRWLIFRIMIGAGLIKLRGDSCWRDLTCLDYHYETQPIPNPLSRAFHFEPRVLSRLGVVFNHVTESAMPWLLLFGRTTTRIAGSFFLAFQLILIASGNLSFLNWLTIVPALACFDDALLARVLPRSLAGAALAAEAGSAARAARMAPRGLRTRSLALAGLTLTIAWLSVPVVRNLVSGQQVMNTSFGAFDLVNTYGAFGSIGRRRAVVVFEGTSDADPGPDATWHEYELPCAPGDPERRPCVVSPYHYRLDWQIWFAAMSTPDRYPWTVRLVWKLLHNDAAVLSLFAVNPFPDAPPRYIRARQYVYRFAPRGSGRWWDRELVRDWITPLSADDRRLQSFLKARGWLESSGE